MDIVFNCTNKTCAQELAVDEAGAGTEIECPTCGETLTVPEPTPENTIEAEAPPAKVPGSTKAASGKISVLPKKEKSFSVPVHTGPGEVLIKKPKPTLEVAAKEIDKKIRLKTIRHSECQEVGKDKFDETVTDFLQRIGQENIVGVHSVSYSHFDVTTRQVLSDFGLMIMFRG
ncbi:MAG: hypothetical protein JWM68_706 [Verrucomicrobiales bacterium]|nr:hypothetical protein [Verrucomicrobiales bacterium]